MCQSPPVYHESPSLALLEPCMLARLPKVIDPTARAHIIQLAPGIFERHSVLVANIASSTAPLTCSPGSGQVAMLESVADDWLSHQSRLNSAGVR